MKIPVFILLLTFCTTSFAQFPSPTNFQYDFTYYSIGQMGLCAGMTTPEDAFTCSSFSWDMPDTSLTTATLDHFEIINETTQYGVELVQSLPGTSFTTKGGFSEKLNVFADYTNPEGRSAPSITETSQGIPLHIGLNQTTKALQINSNQPFDQFQVFSLHGNLLYSTNAKPSATYLKSLGSGVYILVATSKVYGIYSQKFTID